MTLPPTPLGPNTTTRNHYLILHYLLMHPHMFQLFGQLVVLRKSVKVFLYIFFCQSQLLPNLAPGDYILNILDSTLPKDSSAQVLAFNECFRRFLTFFFLIHKLETGKQCLVVLKMILWLTKITTYKKDSGL